MIFPTNHLTGTSTTLLIDDIFKEMSRK